MMRWMAPLRHLGARVLIGREPPANREPSMNEITTIGLDLAKHVFPGTRGRCSGGDGSAQAASTSAGSGVLQSTAIAWAVMHQQENYQRMATAA